MLKIVSRGIRASQNGHRGGTHKRGNSGAMKVSGKKTDYRREFTQGKLSVITDESWSWNRGIQISSQSGIFFFE
jgi:hypothetical protein